MAYLEQDGEALPAVAPVAVQQGEYAAALIRARARGQSLDSFRYTDKGSMAVIGRGAAVASLFGIDFSGFMAWMIWLALHLATLIGFRNRLWVMVNWAYDYLLYDRKVRLITHRVQTHLPEPEIG